MYLTNVPASLPRQDRGPPSHAAGGLRGDPMIL